MALFGDEKKLSGLMKDSSEIIIDNSVIESKPIDAKKIEQNFDFNKAMQDLASKSSGDSIMVDDIGFSSSIFTGSELFTVSQIEKIKALIHDKKYQEALNELAKFLEKENNNHEAIYLKSLCQINLGLIEPALKTLAVLNSVRINNELETRIEGVKQRIRNHYISIILMQLLLPKRFQLIEQIKNLIDLDPGCEFYYVSLASLLIQKGMLREALGYINYGFAKIPSKLLLILPNMKRHVLDLLMKEEMRPVIKLFKEKSYAKARKRMEAFSKELDECNELKIFKSYLQKLESKSSIFKKANYLDCSLDGTPVEKDFLHSIIVSDEISLGFKHYDKGDFKTALSIFREGQKYVYQYPYLNYLMALSIHNHFMISLIKRSVNPSNRNEIKSDIEMGLKYVDIGLKDIYKNDSQLIKNKLLLFLDRINEAEETDYINATLREELFSLIKNGQGIKNLTEWNSFYTRLSDLKKKSSQVQKELKFEFAKKHLNQIVEYINDNLKALNQMKGSLEQSELVFGHIHEYNEIMKKITELINKKGNHNAWSLFTDCKNLRSEIERDLPKINVPQYINEMNAMLKDINNLIDQFNRAL